MCPLRIYGQGRRIAPSRGRESEVVFTFMSRLLSILHVGLALHSFLRPCIALLEADSASVEVSSALLALDLLVILLLPRQAGFKFCELCHTLIHAGLQHLHARRQLSRISPRHLSSNRSLERAPTNARRHVRRTVNGTGRGLDRRTTSFRESVFFRELWLDDLERPVAPIALPSSRRSARSMLECCPLLTTTTAAGLSP